MKVLAIIPARKNSKELPKKNISLFCGKPLITWTIESALDSGIFDKVMVSTDCETTASISVENGAEVPFIRPTSLSGSNSDIKETIKDVLKKYSERLKIDFDAFCLLQPTSPLRNHLHIRKAFTIFENKSLRQLVSISKVRKHPAWMKKINSNGLLENYLPKANSSPQRQKLDSVFILNGAIYFSKIDAFWETGSLHQESSGYYEMEEAYSVDIDNALDFACAEFLMKNSFALIES
jgi:CMP-N,N'-diacetyllegionaminic acid synthase